MKNKFIDLPQNITKKNYSEVLDKVVSICKKESGIKLCLLHGSYPGVLGVSDIDIIIFYEINKTLIDLEKSFIDIKNISTFIDVMFLPLSLFDNIEKYIQLNNVNFIYFSDDFDVAKLNKDLTYSKNIELITTLVSYLYKIRHIKKEKISGNIRLRRNLLLFKSILYSIKFISTEKNCKKNINYQFLLKETIFLRKNWHMFYTDEYYVRFINLQNIFLKNRNEILSRYDLLLKSKGFYYKKRFFNSTGTGFLIDVNLLPFFVENFLQFFIYRIFKLKRDPYLLVPSSIISLLFISRNYSYHKNNLNLSDISFKSDLFEHLSLASEHKKSLRDFKKIPISVFSLGRVL